MEVISQNVSGYVITYYDNVTYDQIVGVVDKYSGALVWSLPFLSVAFLITVFRVVWEKKRSRIVILILVQWTGIILNTGLTRASLSWNLSHNYVWCEALGTCMIMLFTSTHLTFYLVLLERSKTTTVLVSNNIRFQRLRLWVKYQTYFAFGVICVTPFIKLQFVAAPCYAFNKETEYAVGYCFIGTWAPVAIVYGASDAMLSVGYLLLFIVPLKSTISRIANVHDTIQALSTTGTSTTGGIEESKKLRKIALWNMILSSCQMTISITSFALLSVDLYSLEDKPWRAISVQRSCFIDLLGIAITTCLLTQAWVPRRLKSMIQSCKVSTRQTHYISNGSSTGGLSEGWTNKSASFSGDL